MQKTCIEINSLTAIDRARALVRDLHKEIQMLHVQELDRAFFATAKGMTYRTRQRLASETGVEL